MEPFRSSLSFSTSYAELSTGLDSTQAPLDIGQLNELCTFPNLTFSIVLNMSSAGAGQKTHAEGARREHKGEGAFLSLVKFWHG